VIVVLQLQVLHAFKLSYIGNFTPARNLRLIFHIFDS